MGAKENSTYNERDVKKIREKIKKTNSFLDVMEKIGVEMPEVKKAFKRLLGALSTGVDAAEAAEEARVALEKANKEAMAACKGDEICELEYQRKWQSRNVKYTLDPSNESSAVSKLIKKTISNYVPDICKTLNSCEKDLKKQEKAGKK